MRSRALVRQEVRMVLLHVKKTDELQFLFETPVASKVDDTVEELVEIWNMQIQIRRLCDSVRPNKHTHTQNHHITLQTNLVLIVTQHADG
jgi:hypothetical protein